MMANVKQDPSRAHVGFDFYRLLESLQPSELVSAEHKIKYDVMDVTI